MCKTVYLDNSKTPAKVNSSLKIAGLCISYNYYDTLKFMLPANHMHFDKLYIVTQKDDTATVKLCKKYKNVKILYYNFSNNGKKFDKYGAMKYAQRIIYKNHPDHWYANIDSDIVLPNNFKSILKKTKLDKNNIYGITRKEVLKSSELVDKNKLTDIDYGDKRVIGFFQLYKKKALQHSKYNNAADGDVKFGYNFKKKIKLHHLKSLHLGPKFVNWNGKVAGFIDDKKISIKDLYYNIRTNGFRKAVPKKRLFIKRKVMKKRAPKKRYSIKRKVMKKRVSKKRSSIKRKVMKKRVSKNKRYVRK
jgi:hypothetical protein